MLTHILGHTSKSHINFGQEPLASRQDYMYIYNVCHSSKFIFISYSKATKTPPVFKTAASTPRTQWISLRAATLDVSHPSERSARQNGFIFPNCSRWKCQQIFDLPPTSYFFWYAFLDLQMIKKICKRVPNLFVHTFCDIFFWDKKLLWLGYFENWDASLYCWDLLSWTLKHQKEIACTINHHLTLRFNWFKLGQPKKRMSHQIWNFRDLKFFDFQISPNNLNFKKLSQRLNLKFFVCKDAKNLRWRNTVFFLNLIS